MSEVAAVLMASGHSTRFRPLNRRHKSLIEIGGKPLLRWTVEGIKSSGIDRIVIVHRPGDRELLEFYLRDLDVVLVEHPKELVKGSRSVLKVAYDHIKGYDKILMTAPYHVETARLMNGLLSLLDEHEAALVLSPKTGTEQYGNAFVDGDRIVRVLEKKRVTSGRKISAVYAFSSSLVDRIVSEGENLYDRVGEAVLEFILDELARSKGIPFIEASLPSLKYPRHALDRLKIVLERMFDWYSNKSEIHSGDFTMRGNVIIGEDVEIAPGAYIENSVISDGVKIYEHAVIKNSFIGRNAVIGTHAIVRDSSIGAETLVGAHMEIARSILESDVHTHSGFIGDSVIDIGSRIGAGTVVANLRLDRGNIHVTLCDGRRIDTRRRKLGAILGHDVFVGINASIMPGTIVGSESVIYPGTVAKGCSPERGVIRREFYHSILPNINTPYFNP